MAGDRARPARPAAACSTTTTTRASRPASRALVAPGVAELGDPVAGEDDLRGKLRGAPDRRRSPCSATTPPTVARAASAVERGRADAAPVDPELVAAATSVVAATGDADDYERLLDGYRTAATPQDQLRHLYALAEFDDEALVLRTCELCHAPAR